MNIQRLIFVCTFLGAIYYVCASTTGSFGLSFYETPNCTCSDSTGGSCSSSCSNSDCLYSQRGEEADLLGNCAPGSYASWDQSWQIKQSGSSYAVSVNCTSGCASCTASGSGKASQCISLGPHASVLLLKYSTGSYQLAQFSSGSDQGVYSIFTCSNQTKNATVTLPLGICSYVPYLGTTLLYTVAVVTSANSFSRVCWGCDNITNPYSLQCFGSGDSSTGSCINPLCTCVEGGSCNYPTTSPPSVFYQLSSSSACMGTGFTSTGSTSGSISAIQLTIGGPVLVAILVLLALLV